MADIRSINGHPIKVGTGNIDGEAVTYGKIADGAVYGAKLLPATNLVLGGVKVDGTTIAVDQDGVISLALENGDEEDY